MLPIETMVSWDLLGPDILISHATNATSEEASQLVKAGAHISTTPSTELQMSLGDPICFHPDFHSISSLGIDCHTATSADIPGQMRLALQSARGRRNQRILNTGKTPASIEHQVEQAFNLGTIMGARAIGMGNELGSLEVGKFADLVVWDGMSPGMVCAVEQDPVAAVVLHSSVRDVEMVMIDGVVRKEGGKLCPVKVDGKDMPWGDVARELLRSREEIEKKVQQIDYEKAKKGMIKAFYIQEDTLSHE
jgi:cytosine/adenosine deaminase-related metal-dependent hydrolase